MSNPTLKILPALMVAITAALVTTQPVFGGLIVNQLVMTETSSTSLSATYNNAALTVVNTGPDLWTLTLPTTFTANGIVPLGWVEPENANNFNVLSLIPGVADSTLSVASDVSGFSGIVTSNGSSIAIGHDPNGALIQASFFDNAATSEAAVPDTGTTFSLFGLSLAGLAFLRRKIAA
jgi:VPDSG-CTERM motif